MKNANRGKSAKNSGSYLPILIPVLAVAVAAVVIIFYRSASGQPSGGQASPNNPSEVRLNDAGDLLIPTGEVSETARFYPVTIGGIEIEVLAVKAPDGTIRTAFNTCQVCYDSGRGYYKQDGDVLVCQNCGNRFKTSDVEVTKGGCNPVPIFDENKTVDDTNITISGEYMKLATQIFQNWKTA